MQAAPGSARRLGLPTADDINPVLPEGTLNYGSYGLFLILGTLNYGNIHGIFLILGSAGFISSTVGLRALGGDQGFLGLLGHTPVGGSRHP